MTSGLQTSKLTLVGLFTALTAVGALISFPLPFTPVPFTLQITFTTMAGFVLGAKYGAFSQLAYLLLGAIGLPVFANRMAGFSILVGPTAGFLWGFILSAVLIGWLAARYRTSNPAIIFGILSVGLLVIYSLGTLGLMAVLGLAFVQAVMAGVAPYILFDLLKIALATFLIRKLIPLGIINS